jgi:hypothetical protein
VATREPPGDAAAERRQCGGGTAERRRCGGDAAAGRRCGGDAAAKWRRDGGGIDIPIDIPHRSSLKLECERAPQGRASISSRPSRESENQPSSIEHRKSSSIPIETSIIDLGIQSEIASEMRLIALSFAERRF